MPRSKDIEKALKGVGQYEKATLQLLVAYLGEQMSSGSYDLEANLAILKLYAIYPEESNNDVTQKVLLKAMMNYPSTDFSLCIYQIPEGKVAELKDVMKLATLLETAKFKQFWKEADSVELLKQAKGWEASVRKFVASVVSATYRAIGTAALAELLNLKENSKEMLAILKEHEWQSEGKKVLVNPTLVSAPEANAQEANQVSTALSLDEYKRLMAATMAL